VASELVTAAITVAEELPAPDANGSNPKAEVSGTKGLIEAMIRRKGSTTRPAAILVPPRGTFLLVFGLRIAASLFSNTCGPNSPTAGAENLIGNSVWDNSKRCLA